MEDRQYQELLNAILDLREATEVGFRNVYRHFAEDEQHWDRRFNALETRVEDGFREMTQRFDRVDMRFDRFEHRVGALELRNGGLA